MSEIGWQHLAWGGFIVLKQIIHGQEKEDSSPYLRSAFSVHEGLIILLSGRHLLRSTKLPDSWHSFSPCGITGEVLGKFLSPLF